MVKLTHSVSLNRLSLAALAGLATQPASGQTLNYGVLEGIFGETVTASATGSPQKASDAPVAMEIITAEEIKRSGVTNIADIVSRLAGVNVIQSAALDHNVAVRGYNEPSTGRLLVLVNGRQVYLDFSGFTDWDSLPVRLEEIRQIEVVKGPNTALFGFNAAAGVINIVTYNPAFDTVSAATVRDGINGERNASGVLTEKIGDTSGVRLSAGYDTQHEFKDQPNQVLFGPKYNPQYPTLPTKPSAYSVNGQGVFSLTDKTQLMTEATTTWTQYGYATEPFYVVEQGVDRTYSYRTQLTSDTQYGLLSGQVYRNSIIYNAVDDTQTNENLTVAQLQDLVHLGEWSTLRLSAEWRKNDMNSTPTDDGRIGYSVWSGSVMLDQHLSSSWVLTSAVRFDTVQLHRDGNFPAGIPQTNADWNRSIAEGTYNVGLVGQLSDEHSVRINTARGLELPNLFDVALLNNLAPAPPPTYSYLLVLGNPSLNPTVVTNYEVGWDWAMADGGNLRLSAYYEMNQNLTAISSYGFPADYYVFHGPYYPTSVLQAVPYGNSDVTGLEASYKRKLGSDFNFGLNGTLLKVHDNLYTALPRRIDYQKTTPQFEANASLGWTHGPWRADAFLKFVSATDSFEDGNQSNLPGDITRIVLYHINAYENVDANIAYKFDQGLTLALEARNLFDNGAVRAVGLRIPTQVDFALRYDY